MFGAAAITFPYVAIGKRVCISGADGTLRAAIARRLSEERADVVGAAVDTETARAFFAEEKIEAVVVISERTARDAALIVAAHKAGVEKLMYVAPAAGLYPRDAPQPLMEVFLQSDAPPAHCDGGVKAALAAIKLCADIRREHGADFFACVNAELYGPGCYDASIVATLIDHAKRDGVKGLRSALADLSASARHDLIHVDDAAEAMVHLLQNYTGEMHVNVGAGFDISTSELAGIVASIGRMEGDFAGRPGSDAATRALLNIRRLAATGWRPRIGLREGIAETWGAHHVS
jgi:GDP-L-fucose synthase